MVYLVSSARPARRPVPTTVIQSCSRQLLRPPAAPLRVFSNTAKAAMASDCAGRSCIKLKLASTGAPVITIQNTAAVCPGVICFARLQTLEPSSKANGDIQSLSAQTQSPTTAMPAASQEGKTGGETFSIAGTTW